MDDILSRIMEHKQRELGAARERAAGSRGVKQPLEGPPIRDFAQALSAYSGVALIAEVKKASPSAGVIREDFDPVQIATTYIEHGAAGLSVLTDERFFQGRLDDLCAIRAIASVPVLRKDFIIDETQVAEARAAGADAVLLIAECLPGDRLGILYDCVQAFGMQALVELYDAENLDRVLDLRPALVGVNNRDLRTFQTDLGHAIRMRQRVPSEVVFVAESGIRTPEDVERLRNAGVDAMLVGESLIKCREIGPAVDRLLGPPSPRC